MTTTAKKTAAKKTAAKKTAAKKTAAKKTAAKKTTAKKTAAKKTAARKTAAKKTAAGQAAANKTTTRASARKTPKSSGYSFPFLGAGDASYFEWGGLYVWFEVPPPRTARARLAREIPEPFRHDATWGGSVLHATSGDQFINLHICTAYAGLGDDLADDDDDDDDADGLEFGVGQPFPNDKQMAAFEADITAWLHALHRKHPIAFVARREDCEAGGTRLDAWHRWSLTRFAADVLPRIEQQIRRPGVQLENWAVHEVLGLVLDSPIRRQVPAAVKRWYEKDRSR